MQDFFAYILFNLPLNKKTDLLLGLRWNNRKLNSVFRDPSFPFSKIENKNTSFVKSILLSYKPISQASISASYYGGFRNPNLDDVGKVFSKNLGSPFKNRLWFICVKLMFTSIFDTLVI